LGRFKLLITFWAIKHLNPLNLAPFRSRPPP
jgi:hypothetical protein